MKGMESAVDHRRGDDRDPDEKDQAGVEREEPSEELSSIGDRIVDRPHPPQEHRRVEESIPPRESLEVAVAGHPDEERYHDDRGRDGQVQREPLDEPAACDRAVLARFVHGGLGALVLQRTTRTVLHLRRHLAGRRGLGGLGGHGDPRYLIRLEATSHYGSSPLGPYTCGTFDPIGRRYVVIWPR